MARHPTRNPRLQERDYAILYHVRRYRISTPEILHKLFFDDAERNAVTKVTSKLCESDFLQPYPLYSSHKYFMLGRRGAKVVNVPPKKIKPLHQQALSRDFGTLMFCCEHVNDGDPEGEMGREETRQLISFSEIDKKYSGFISGRLDSSHYYHDEVGGKKFIGYVWVDGGGTIDHIVTKVERDILGKRQDIPALRELIDVGSFVVAVVTLTEEKRQELEHALQKIPTRVYFRVVAVPDLVNLL